MEEVEEVDEEVVEDEEEEEDDEEDEDEDEDEEGEEDDENKRNRNGAGRVERRTGGRRLTRYRRAVACARGSTANPSPPPAPGHTPAAAPHAKASGTR